MTLSQMNSSVVQTTILLLVTVSWFDLKTRFFVPTRAGAKTPSAAAVKAERRDALPTSSSPT